MAMWKEQIVFQYHKKAGVGVWKKRLHKDEWENEQKVSTFKLLVFLKHPTNLILIQGLFLLVQKPLQKTCQNKTIIEKHYILI